MIVVTVLGDLLRGNSALLLYFSESTTNSQNFTIIPTFWEFSKFHIFFVLRMFYCVSLI